jgi:hypothetical protein
MRTEETKALAKKLNEAARERRRRKDQEHAERMATVSFRAHGVRRTLDPAEIYRTRRAGGGAR